MHDTGTGYSADSRDVCFFLARGKERERPAESVAVEGVFVSGLYAHSASGGWLIDQLSGGAVLTPLPEHIQQTGTTYNIMRPRRKPHSLLPVCM